MVTLAGMHGEHPPTDDAGFLAFARDLPSPEVADLLETAHWMGPVVTHRLHSNQRRLVERLRRVPGGLVLRGDAVCSFNPPTARACPPPPSRPRPWARPSTGYPPSTPGSPAWQLTTGADFALPATPGPKAPGTDLLNRYMPHVFRASQVSEEVALRVIEVTTLAPAAGPAHPGHDGQGLPRRPPGHSHRQAGSRAGSHRRVSTA